MPAYGGQQSRSIIVPVMMCVFAVLIVVAFARQEIELGRLDKTDRIACSFINADATVRTHQATNALKTTDAQAVFIARTNKLHALFTASAKKHHTLAASAPLLSYLDAQRNLATTSRNQSAKNIVLTRQLAAKGRALAAQLNC